jgi:hypothetical protein
MLGKDAYNPPPKIRLYPISKKSGKPKTWAIKYTTIDDFEGYWRSPTPNPYYKFLQTLTSILSD